MQLIQQTYLLSCQASCGANAMPPASTTAPSAISSFQLQQQINPPRLEVLRKGLHHAELLQQPGKQAMSELRSAENPVAYEPLIKAAVDSSAVVHQLNPEVAGGNMLLWEARKGTVKQLLFGHSSSDQASGADAAVAGPSLSNARKGDMQQLLFGHSSPVQKTALEVALASMTKTQLEDLASREVPQELSKADQRKFKVRRAEARKLLEQLTAAGES